jgi:hypothetical protein
MSGSVTLAIETGTATITIDRPASAKRFLVAAVGFRAERGAFECLAGKVCVGLGMAAQDQRRREDRDVAGPGEDDDVGPIPECRDNRL